MHLSIFSLITSLLVLALSSTISAQLDPKRFPFRLRAALPDPRSTPPIKFNHYGELDSSTGDVIVDLDKQAEGIQVVSIITFSAIFPYI